jgi:hypothetical protein
VNDGALEIRTRIDIDAPIADVWAILVDFARYPEWSATMDRVDGVAEAGATVHVWAAVGTIAARDFDVLISELVAPERLVWEGGDPDQFYGHHSFEFTALAPDRTRFDHSETFTGPMAQELYEQVAENLTADFVAFDHALKRRAEDG